MLKREKNKMPPDVKNALVSNNLLSDYKARPAYQQNDYVGWITRAKLSATRTKRLDQMLKELEVGGVYMNMKHPASAKHSNKKAR
ncbi:hypothetical protein COU13_00780 [Candidatus Kaiserbacteria bacterium CG10_big_fil_rev_8_21_14_0_10_43_70]|uniref:YdeI/OmpD-associated family protein n=1 Tax=Candidatus Kaiserbacteria bacterium CG10_big_fil_rev_8_21_14_0_10_43_70 TaxID=1974605 RepID=A0A2H0UJ81_9BACT|nr:MAG: hypothetical protein COU13_00780 [Candidatus Kaiserbacteria bacterium CG10_big_fil_rev_8_21_14_0_10_43_70]